MIIKPNQLTPIPEGIKIKKIPAGETSGVFFVISHITRFMSRENKNSRRKPDQYQPRNLSGFDPVESE